MNALEDGAERRGCSLPADAYASQVEALYRDARSLAVGILAAVLTTLSTGLLVNDLVVDGIAVGLACLGALRLLLIRRFWAVRPACDLEALRRWEKGYILGGLVHLALLGCFCIAAFGRSSDPLAWLASISITMAYLIGTPGRSFASNLLVDAQILVSAVTMTSSLAIAGPRYWTIIAFVVLPFFVVMKRISRRLRGIFQDAVLRARDLGFLAARFDTALTNMPHGLAMFSAEGCISVANQRFAALLHEALPLQGRSIVDVLRTFDAFDQHAEVGRRFVAGVSERTSAAAPERWVSTKADGYSICFTIQRIADGGGVIIAQDVTEQVRAQDDLAFLARHDALTGLPNRFGIREMLSARLRSDAGGAGLLMFIDLDRFKGVNDTLGHAVGDLLLKAVGQRLRSVSGREALLARFGGDEFVLHHPLLRTREEGMDLARNVIACLSDPYDVEGHRILIGATIGIAHISGSDDVDLLLRNADLALYSAKSEEKGTFRFFETAMLASAASRRELEGDLREAIGLGQIMLHFQPIVRTSDGRVSSCEALLRWRHPSRGLVSPMEFIGIAEETGYIWELGTWVLKQACRECARWPGDVGVAVNVSALQFQRGDFAQTALLAVMEAGLSPRRLELEITETSLLRDLDAARAQLLRLRHCGFRLNLDDFGTGYSSLGYLRRLPFDKVKLDRSFLLEADGDARGLKVLEGVARLCADLDMSVVLEGIETPDHLAIARRIGIAEVQGFLIKRPSPAAEVHAALSRGDTFLPEASSPPIDDRRYA